jgi:hypothetical protein
MQAGNEICFGFLQHDRGDAAQMKQPAGTQTEG